MRFEGRHSEYLDPCISLSHPGLVALYDSSLAQPAYAMAEPERPLLPCADMEAVTLKQEGTVLRPNTLISPARRQVQRLLHFAIAVP